MTIAIISIILVAIALGALVIIIRNARNKAEARAAKALQGETVILRDPSANLFGLQSRGMGQVRGNGLLVLTNRRLWFHMWLPARELSFPLERIEAVATPRSHLGKAVGRPLLAVEMDDGEVVAWCVRGVDRWVGELESVAGRQARRPATSSTKIDSITEEPLEWGSSVSSERVL